VTDQVSRVQRAVVEASKLTDVPRTLEETLQVITRAARAATPGFDHVGVSIAHSDGAIETKSASDQLVWYLDEVQYSLREGPCYDSIRDSTVTVAEDVRHDPRWPAYVPLAVERGLRAQLAVGLCSGVDRLGGMNLYSTSDSTIPDEAVDIAELFAAQAAIALRRSREAVQMGQALETRKTIGEAVGIVMQRYEMDEERAFQYLVRVSSTNNIKLRDVAAELVQNANQRFTSPRVP
jgi:GAF domain-containing protein